MGVEFTAVAHARTRQSATVVVQQCSEHIHIEDWPIVPSAWLQHATPRFTHQECELMLRHKIVPYSWSPECTVHAVVHEGALHDARAKGLKIGGGVSPTDYRKLVQRNFSHQIQKKAVNELSRSKPWASARNRLSGGQKLFAIISLVLCAGMASVFTLSDVLSFAHFLAGLFFLMVVCLRSLCLFPLPSRQKPIAPPLNDVDLPIYTVLVPLFRETEVIGQLISALAALDYPAEKLDIKIILEETDRPMHMAISAMNLPWYFDIIVVPVGKPQTKPRALNYAMQFARGTLATIYDSEDIPHPSQLRVAAARFADAEDDVACLQASLDFYNPRENWLTHQFAAEYAALFHVVLPALAAYGLPIPLGSTSNHFRVSALNAVGAWDPFNVTEDADLGFRLARHGYQVGVLCSSTLEEATSTYGNWMKQRRRWLKGFLQTWLVHNRNPLQVLLEMGIAGFCTMQVMTLGVFASALLHPVLLLIALWNFLPAQLTAHTATPVGSILSGMSLAVLLAGYVSAICACKKGLHIVGARGWTQVLCTLPLYWLLISAAAWMALWDFVIAPFHWHKTKHGQSRSMHKPAVQD